VRIYLVDPHACNPADAGLRIMETLQRLYPGRHLFEKRTGDAFQMFERALGDDSILMRLAEDDLAGIRNKVESDRNAFLKRREKALIYP
jgi:uncharacterized protein YbbC (DUF1343 family)